jgi:hypothetical protein
MQRDLDELERDGLIEVVTPGGKPQRYRRLGEYMHEDELIWEYTLRQVRELITEAVPARRLERPWERLLHEPDGPLLDEWWVRIVPDSLRLRPVELFPEVLEAVLTGLRKDCTLEVWYENARGERGPALLHPPGPCPTGADALPRCPAE